MLHLSASASRKLGIAVSAGLVVAIAAGCGSGSSSKGQSSSPASSSLSASNTASHTVHVVAAENFWGNITGQIGGSHVDVTSIISDPNADPHTYETDPKDAAAISAASFVILNGVGYDDFASKLLSASPNSCRTVITIQKVAGVTGSNPNPHLWYDPTYVKEAADAITAALIKSDPADASTFTSNEKTFLTAYQPYIDELAKIKAKYGGTKISYTERVPGYLVQTAGLVLGTPASFSQAVEDGTDPSPADTADIQRRHHRPQGQGAALQRAGDRFADRQDQVACPKGRRTDRRRDAKHCLRRRRTSRPGSLTRPSRLFAALGG